MPFLFLLLFSQSIFAADACEQIAAGVCSTETVTDPTGTTRGRTNDGETLKKELDRIKPVNQVNFRNELTDPGNADFRKKALAIFGSKIPQCADPNQASFGCSVKLSEALTEFMTWEQTSSSPDDTKANLAALNISANEMFNFMQMAPFKSVVKKAAQYFERRTDQSEKLAHVKDVLFPRVKKLFKERIDRLEISKAQKKEMMKRINQLEIYDCHAHEDNLLGYFETNAFFEEPFNVRFCRGYLENATSEFSLVHVLAHEMGHAITPCSMGEDFPLPDLTKCLRSKASFNAKSFEDESKHCSEKDQIGEATADWYSNEILPAYMEEHHPGLTSQQYAQGYSNAHRLDGCESHEGFDPHPETPVRVGAGMLTQPRIRAQLQCQSEPEYGYCDSNYPQPFFVNRSRRESQIDNQSDGTSGSSSSGGGSGVGIGN